MKIDPETRHQDLSLFVREHLTSIPSDEAKLAEIVLVFTMYDLPLFLCLISINKLEFILFAAPFVIIIHLWLIRILVKNVYSTQLEIVLYTGCWGLLGFISLFILFLGMLYYYYNVTSVVSHIIITIFTFISVYLLVRFQIRKFNGDPTKERKESDQFKYIWLLSATPGMAYLFTVITRDMKGLSEFLTIIAMYFFVIFCAYFAAKFLHRYFFMKANMKYVIYQPHGNKKKEKLIKQGVEIK